MDFFVDGRTSTCFIRRWRRRDGRAADGCTARVFLAGESNRSENQACYCKHMKISLQPTCRQLEATRRHTGQAKMVLSFSRGWTVAMCKRAKQPKE